MFITDLKYYLKYGKVCGSFRVWRINEGKDIALIRNGVGFAIISPIEVTISKDATDKIKTIFQEFAKKHKRTFIQSDLSIGSTKECTRTNWYTDPLPKGQEQDRFSGIYARQSAIEVNEQITRILSRPVMPLYRTSQATVNFGEIEF